MKKQQGNVAGVGVIVVIAIWAAFIYGWIMNIVKIIGAFDDPVTSMFIARCVGAVVAPVGAILGYF